MSVFICRDCGSADAHASRARNIFERRLLPLLLLRTVRCVRCFRRRYVTVFCKLKHEQPLHQLPPTPPNQLAA